MSAPVVETHSLAKTYGLSPVLREVELRLMPGAGAFVIGGNGAGKSTLLRILAGLEAPSDGYALVFGQDTRKLAARYRRRIGVVAHQSFLYPNLTARENLEFYGELYSSPTRMRPPNCGLNVSAWPTLPIPACVHSRAGWNSGCLPRVRCFLSLRCYCWTSRSRRSIMMEAK